MAKPIMKYTVKLMTLPGTGTQVYVPQITDSETDTLLKVVTDAINTGRIIGLKPAAAQHFVSALCARIAETIKLGYAVNFGGYFRVYLDINDTLASEYSPLVKGVNDLGIGVQTLSGFTAGIGDFTWEYAGPAVMTTQSVDYASVTALMALGQTAANTVVATGNQPVTATGKGLSGVTAANVYLRRYVDGAVAEEVPANAELLANADFIVFTNGLPVPSGSDPAAWIGENVKARLVIGQMVDGVLAVYSEGPEFTYVAAA